MTAVLAKIGVTGRSIAYFSRPYQFKHLFDRTPRRPIVLCRAAPQAVMNVHHGDLCVLFRTPVASRPMLFMISIASSRDEC